MKAFKLNLKLLFLFLILSSTFIYAQSVYAEDITIIGNGSGSTSEVNVTAATQTNIEQSNTAIINNDVSSTSNSGNNQADNNSGGDQTAVQSGSASSSVEITNEANSSSVTQNCCSSPAPGTVSISGNGDNSANNANVSNSSSTTVTINNNATITTNIHGTANSGGNKAENNTGGNVSITTGAVSVRENVINVVNNANVEISKNSNPEFYTKIGGNGAGSLNDSKVVNSAHQIIKVNNTADILNISTWFANSGQNEAFNNSGGDVSVITGPVEIESIIKNVGINSSEIVFNCCQTETTPAENGPPPVCEKNCGGENTPGGNNPGTTTPSGGSNSGGSSNGGSGGGGGGGSSGGSGNSSVGSVLGIESGSVLAATGSSVNLWLNILAMIMLLMGIYLKLKSGRSPNYLAVR